MSDMTAEDRSNAATGHKANLSKCVHPLPFLIALLTHNPPIAPTPLKSPSRTASASSRLLVVRMLSTARRGMMLQVLVWARTAAFLEATRLP